jgi:hypothetical protein
VDINDIFAQMYAGGRRGGDKWWRWLSLVVADILNLVAIPSILVSWLDRWIDR